MTLFKYTLIDGVEYLQDADYYEVVQYETVNDRKEVSIVTEYIFWKDGKDVWRVPMLFMESIREIG
jgi:hypothetical protein